MKKYLIEITESNGEVSTLELETDRLDWSTWLKVFNDLLCPDKIISSRSKLLPEGSQIVDLGVGKSFIEKYKKKYKVK
jgi:hypothetical protein